MTLKTCTKINVGLNVLRKRPDGYHDIETLFVPYYGYGDVLAVEPAEEFSIEIVREGGVSWNLQEDLTARAWRLLKADFPQLPAVAVRLEKHAPVGAGLGGGSADAAFMLKVLNELGGLGLSDAALASYAARLGSDCAFFIYCRPMLGTGRGEVLEPFDVDLSGYRIQVELPLDASGGPVSVSTREAYDGIVPRDRREGAGSGTLLPTLALTNRRKEGPSAGSLSLREALSLPVERWRGIVVNDFEASVCRRHPEIPAMIERMYARGAVYSAMSGSGSAVFGLFK